MKKLIQKNFFCKFLLVCFLLETYAIIRLIIMDIGGGTGMDEMKDVQRIDWMINFYFDMLQNAELDKEKLSASGMLVDLMNLKFKYLGVEREENRGKMTEKEVRKRLSAAGVNLSGVSSISPEEKKDE